MGIAHLEEGAGVGSGLLDRFLDDLVNELRNEQPEREEDALELAAEDDVGDEAAEADEDGDQRDPGQEMPQLIALPVPDVRESHRLQRNGRHGGLRAWGRG